MTNKELRRKKLAGLITQYGSQKAFGDVVSKDPAMFSQIMNGTRNMGDRLARDIEQKLGKNTGWFDVDDLNAQSKTNILGGSNISNLMHSVVAWDSEDDLPAGDYVFIPRYDVHVSAGNGVIVWEECKKEKAQAYRTEFICVSGLRPRSLRVIYAKGSSMEPRIFDGDNLLIDTSQTNIIDGKTYVVRIGDEVFVKILNKQPLGTIAVVSLNQNYPTLTIGSAEADQFEIIARVVQVSSMQGF
jgi:phage repressor protein C with HTH and peptisase S24 domain